MNKVSSPEVWQVVRARSTTEAFSMCRFKLGDERVVDDVRYILKNLQVSRDTPVSRSSYNSYVVTGIFERAENRHPRLWGVTHV